MTTTVGTMEMVVVDGPGFRPVLDQIMDLAAHVPEGEWVATPTEFGPKAMGR